jgi:hypothetical protein
MSGNDIQAAMEGGGFYNRNSALQAAGIALLAPLWSSACRTANLGEGPIRILDLASSQGRNSMVPMAAAIDAVRHRSEPGRAIEIVHTDLPTNDFTALFEAERRTIRRRIRYGVCSERKPDFRGSTRSFEHRAIWRVSTCLGSKQLLASSGRPSP